MTSHTWEAMRKRKAAYDRCVFSKAGHDWQPHPPSAERCERCTAIRFLKHTPGVGASVRTEVK